MALLKTLKASTLMETLVASVLIVIVFMVSSLILNNLFGSTVKHQTRAIENRLYELEYLTQNARLTLPYYEDFKEWSVSIEVQVERNRLMIIIEAVNSATKTIIEHERYDNR